MTTDPNTSRPSLLRRWWFTGFALLLGVGFLIAGLIADEPSAGIVGLVVMACYGAGLHLLRRRSESAALLAGEIRDERQLQIATRASALTGQVLAVVLVAGMLVSTARGAADAGTWSALCAVAGATFLLGTIVIARRS